MDRVGRMATRLQAASILSIPSTLSIPSIKNRPFLTAPGSRTT